MNAYKAHLINAFTLIIMGLWGYLASGSYTSFIPLGFGMALLPLTNGVRYENKIIAHIAVLLSLLVLIALVAKPLMGAIDSGDFMRIFRVGAMCVTSLIAVIYFVKSFIDARKKKNAKAQ